MDDLKSSPDKFGTLSQSSCIWNPVLLWGNGFSASFDKGATSPWIYWWDGKEKCHHMSYFDVVVSEYLEPMKTHLSEVNSECILDEDFIMWHLGRRVMMTGTYNHHLLEHINDLMARRRTWGWKRIGMRPSHKAGVHPSQNYNGGHTIFFTLYVEAHLAKSYRGGGVSLF